MTPNLSIIILTYNQCEITLRCLESIAYLGTRDDVEIIVVDNGSSDSTEVTIKQRFPWVIYFYLNKNTGVAAGRNYGLERANGNYLMILDNDTIVPENAIESLMNYLDSNSNVGLVAPRLIDTNGLTQYSARPYPGILFKIKSSLGLLKPEIYNEPYNPCYVIGAAQMFRKSIYQKTGPLDDHIFYGPEDADFCIRVRKAGFGVVYLPTVSIRHEYRRITRRRPFTRMTFLHAKALLYFYLKHRRL